MTQSRILIQVSRIPRAYPLPKNVLVARSVPQQDILAHPKTLLFVTHGSINAAMESIFHRVPMVTMPIFTDQGRRKGSQMWSSFLDTGPRPPCDSKILNFTSEFKVFSMWVGP